MIIQFGRNGTIDNEKINDPLVEVIKARIRGEPNVSIRKYLKDRYKPFL